MMETETFTVLTPFGRVAVDFGEEGGCTMTGDDGAIAHLVDVMGRCTGPLGASITPGNLEPRTLVDFCQPPGGMVTVIPPPGFDVELAQAPVLDAVDGDALAKLRASASVLAGLRAR